MIDGLIGGKIYGKPEQRQSKNGKHYTTARVRVPLADGESIFVSAICFDSKVTGQLLALDDGDSVALSGSLTPKVWETKDGETRPSLDMVIHALTTPYHVTRKRQAANPDNGGV